MHATFLRIGVRLHVFSIFMFPSQRAISVSLKVGDQSLRNAEANLHEVPFKLPPEDEARTVLSSTLSLFRQYSGWRRAHSGAH